MEKEEDKNRINQAQFYDLITGEELSWQEIIYDLIKTEQLDPWDINLSILAEKYLERISQLEEESFFVSSKVLLACALLLRLKSDILANRFIQSLDELLYGKKEEKKYVMERIELDEDELPILVPKTPLPRFKKVTLQELMASLSKAIDTENRRIKKEIKVRQAEKSALVVMPRANRINLKDRVIQIYSKIKLGIKKPEKVRITFSEIAPSKEEKLSSFLPILHLSNQERLYLEQYKHYDEIFMMLEKMYLTIKNDENLEEESWPEDKIIKDDFQGESEEFKGFKEALANLDDLEQ
jgi:segregation and condensation protein A